MKSINAVLVIAYMLSANLGFAGTEIVYSSPAYNEAKSIWAKDLASGSLKIYAVNYYKKTTASIETPCGGDSDLTCSRPVERTPVVGVQVVYSDERSQEQESFEFLMKPEQFSAEELVAIKNNANFGRKILALEAQVQQTTRTYTDYDIRGNCEVGDAREGSSGCLARAAMYPNTEREVLENEVIVSVKRK